MGISKQVGEGLGFAIAIDHAVQLLDGKAAPSVLTPLAGLNQAMGAPSEGDQLRIQGENQLEKVFDWASRTSDQLDGYWDKGARVCLMSAARSGDRAWFAVYEPGGVHLAVTNGYDCGGWLDTVKNSANQIRGEIEKSTEAARRSGVYPGVIRDLRRRHRLDWSGWER